MIVEALMNAGLWILNALLNVLDVLPSFPDSAILAIADYLDLVMDNTAILPFFFPVDFALPIVGIVFLMANWKRVYHFVLWVWHKVPLSSD